MAIRTRIRSISWASTLGVLLLVGLAAVALLSVPAAGSAGPQIVEVEPNTPHPNNAGEYVVISTPEPTNLSGWTITAGTTTAALPNETVDGAVAVSTVPELTEPLVDVPVLELEDFFTIAQDGGTVQLARNGTVVDEVVYGPTATAERWTITDDGWTRLHHGATTFEPVVVDVDEATIFPLPDAATKPETLLAGADRRIKLAGYTFASDPAVGALLDAHDRGLRVRVLVDGSPVGGQTAAEVEALDRLADAGVDVQAFDGPMTRYRFHHPKYAVVDDTVVVLTENWKPSGTGGASSRGWGIAITDPALADAVVAVFEADADWADTAAWSDLRADASPVDVETAAGEFPATHQPETVPVDSVRLVTAPDNAEEAVIDLIDGAESSIDVQQVTVADLRFPFLEATIRAAERGVRVRILLDHSWYVERENWRLASDLNALADRHDLPIEARVVDPRSQFEKIHTKGVIVDEQRVLVGSINWNNNSIRNNREVAVIVEGEAVGAYYTAVFESDWRGGSWVVPVEFVGAIAMAGGVAMALGRRWVRFDVTPTTRRRR